MDVYECMSSKELIAECKKRGLKPFEGGKRWNQKFLMKQRLRDDDKKKSPLVECPNNANPTLPKDLR